MAVGERRGRSGLVRCQGHRGSADEKERKEMGLLGLSLVVEAPMIIMLCGRSKKTPGDPDNACYLELLYSLDGDRPVPLPPDNKVSSHQPVVVELL